MANAELTPVAVLLAREAIAQRRFGQAFEALVSLCFNIGAPSFAGSSVVAEINKGRHKAGKAKDRQAAIAAIEAAFAQWNKSEGVVSSGLTKRRRSESERFLGESRAALAEQDRAATPSPGGPAAITGPTSVRGPRLVLP